MELPKGRGLQVLVISNDYVGERMAGPGIRYYHFARELAKRYDVTPMAPGDVDLPLGEVHLVRSQGYGFRSFRKLVRRFDLVVAQRLGVLQMLYLARSKVRVIYDLYVPFISEALGYHAGSGERLGYAL